MLRNIQGGGLSSVAARPRPAASISLKTADEDRIPDPPNPTSPARRKPVARAEDNFHNRPAVIRMRESAGLVYRLWKQGEYIDSIRWKYKVPAKAVEDILRERAA